MEEKQLPRRPRLAAAAAVVGKILLIVLETALLLVALLYGVMYVLTHGPSQTAGQLFAMSVRETSAIGFLADWFYTPRQLAEMEQGKTEYYFEETDTSLITLPSPETQSSTPGTADAWGLVDEDGDGIILQEVHGSGYSGYMMVVLDPTRVIMGCHPESFGAHGYTVADMAASFDAVAGINAGGFVDPDGNGNGSIPDTLVVSEGKIYYAQSGVGNGFVGLDADSRLHVGRLSEAEIRERNIQYGVCFGPVLVTNGEMAPAGTLVSGLNPRTAIGQRSDGAILLLVIDGRQVISLGATYADLAEIMLSYGAVQACNLDGGSSSLLYYNGEYVNNCASVVGIRPVPSTFLVLKEGAAK